MSVGNESKSVMVSLYWNIYVGLGLAYKYMIIMSLNIFSSHFCTCILVMLRFEFKLNKNHIKHALICTCEFKNIFFGIFIIFLKGKKKNTFI